MLPTSSDPLEHLALLKDRIGRLFEVASTRAEFDAGDGATSGWSPLVDLYETEDQVVLIAEVPGLSMEDLDVQVTDSILTLKGGARPQPGGRNVVHPDLSALGGHRPGQGDGRVSPGPAGGGAAQEEQSASPQHQGEVLLR